MKRNRLARIFVAITVALLLVSSAATPTHAVSCKDGTTSKATGPDACSRHGGVADAAPNAKSGPASAAPAQPNAGSPAGVLCKDGTRSTTSGRGACADHGGVMAGAGAPLPMQEKAP
jgi:hypothetical protein